MASVPLRLFRAYSSPLKSRVVHFGAGPSQCSRCRHDTVQKIRNPSNARLAFARTKPDEQTTRMQRAHVKQCRPQQTPSDVQQVLAQIQLNVASYPQCDRLRDVAGVLHVIQVRASNLGPAQSLTCPYFRKCPCFLVSTHTRKEK